jgi:mRNA-degrading endonuclease RelE of RelBE toxin-antitoxin system
MAWTVSISKRATKQLRKLPEWISETVAMLLRDIEATGPVKGNWPNYSKLSDGSHHCHLNKRGRPTYIAIWTVESNQLKLVEVTYVSTREKAPY